MRSVSAWRAGRHSGAIGRDRRPDEAERTVSDHKHAGLSTPMPAPISYACSIPRTGACVVISVGALIGSTR